MFLFSLVLACFLTLALGYEDYLRTLCLTRNYARGFHNHLKDEPDDILAYAYMQLLSRDVIAVYSSVAYLTYSSNDEFNPCGLECDLINSANKNCFPFFLFRLLHGLILRNFNFACYAIPNLATFKAGFTYDTLFRVLLVFMTVMHPDFLFFPLISEYSLQKTSPNNMASYERFIDFIALVDIIDQQNCKLAPNSHLSGDGGKYIPSGIVISAVHLKRQHLIFKAVYSKFADLNVALIYHWNSLYEAINSFTHCWNEDAYFMEILSYLRQEQLISTEEYGFFKAKFCSRQLIISEKAKVKPAVRFNDLCAELLERMCIYQGVLRISLPSFWMCKHVDLIALPNCLFHFLDMPYLLFRSLLVDDCTVSNEGQGQRENSILQVQGLFSTINYQLDKNKTRHLHTNFSVCCATLVRDIFKGMSLSYRIHLDSISNFLDQFARDETWVLSLHELDIPLSHIVPQIEFFIMNSCPLSHILSFILDASTFDSFEVEIVDNLAIQAGIFWSDALFAMPNTSCLIQDQVTPDTDHKGLNSSRNSLTSRFRVHILDITNIAMTIYSSEEALNSSAAYDFFRLSFFQLLISKNIDDCGNFAEFLQNLYACHVEDCHDSLNTTRYCKTSSPRAFGGKSVVEADRCPNFGLLVTLLNDLKSCPSFLEVCYGSLTTEQFIVKWAFLATKYGLRTSFSAYDKQSCIKHDRKPDGKVTRSSASKKDGCALQDYLGCERQWDIIALADSFLLLFRTSTYIQRFARMRSEKILNLISYIENTISVNLKAHC